MIRVLVIIYWWNYTNNMYKFHVTQLHYTYIHSHFTGKTFQKIQSIGLANMNIIAPHFSINIGLEGVAFSHWILFWAAHSAPLRFSPQISISKSCTVSILGITTGLTASVNSKRKVIVAQIRGLQVDTCWALILKRN